MNQERETGCACRQHTSPVPLTRRDMLMRCANGFGAIALSALLAERAYGAVQRGGVARVRTEAVDGFGGKGDQVPVT